MKILHLIPSYLPETGSNGPAIAMHLLNKELVKMGVDVTVYTTNLDGMEVVEVPLGQEVLIDGVKVYYFPITFKPWFYSFALHKALAQRIKDFDLIHITTVFLAMSALGGYYAKKYKKSFIISPHGMLMQVPLGHGAWKKRFYLHLIESHVLARSILHFTSELEQEEFADLGLPVKETVIIPNCIDVDEFKNQQEKYHSGSYDPELVEGGGYPESSLHPGSRVPARLDFVKTKSGRSDALARDGMRTVVFRKKWGIRPEQKIILFLGRLSWIKGLDTLVEAFALVAKQIPEAVLVIAGPDEGQVSSIKYQVSRNKIQDKVILTGKLLGEEKLAAYGSADVFVLPSISENFGMVVLEALASHLPVVITEGVGIAKDSEEAHAGLVVEKDVNQISQAILKILSNPIEAKAMAERGQVLVEKDFTCHAVAEQFVEVYKSLIK